MRPSCKTRRPGPACSELLERRALLTGLTAQYFDRVDFTDLKVARVDPVVDFNWSTLAPDASMKADAFAVRWTGQVRPEFTEDYTFYVRSDDGARLWVDGRLVIDNWVNQSVTEKSVTLPMTAGKDYDVRLDYYDSTSTAQVTMSWSSARRAKQVIPADRLFPSPSGLAATYYNNQDFTGTSVARVDSGVNFAWGTESPAAGISPSTYSVVWTGQVVPQYSQTYTFYVTPEAGATARLRVDRELVFDSSSVQGTGQVQLEAGKLYDIELSYAHGTGGASVSLEWSSPAQARQLVPTTRLAATKVGAIPTRKPTYTNSVLNSDRPDPGVIFDGGYYWMTHTTGGPNNGWPLYRSTDLTSWTFQSNLLNSGNKPAFMTDAFWAPEIHKVNGQYVITGTSYSNTYGHLVIAIGTASEIAGPYTIRSTPIVSDSRHVLDSTIFQDWDGRVYLIWKRDGPSDGTAGSLRMRELSQADLTQFAAGSTEVTLLNNVGGGSWELNLEEAPWMIHRGQYYYLFYSGAHIDTTYAEGVARATSIAGPYTRFTNNQPILQSNTVWGGPGHGSYVQDVDGTVWFYYHARHQDNPDYGRVQMLDRVIWSADGWPTFATGTPSATAMTGPRVDAASGAGRYVVSGDANGSATNDFITVVRNSADASLLDVRVNGIIKLSVSFAEVELLTINGLGGNDTLILDYSRGECSPGAGITFAGSTGTDTVRVIGGASTDEFGLAAGRVNHGTGAVNFDGVEQVTVGTGVYSITADLGAVGFLGVGTDTTVVFAAPQLHLGAVQFTGAAAQFAQAAGMAVTFGALTIDAGGRLDLAGNAVLVDYAGVSPVETLRGYLRTGYRGGTWVGPGIVSSSAAATPNNAIGYAEASDLGLTAFAGRALDGTAVLIEYTPAGDANLDGRVDADDFALIDRGSAMGKDTWVFGDFNYDGGMGEEDYAIINGAAGASAPGSAVTAEVVEPIGQPALASTKPTEGTATTMAVEPAATPSKRAAPHRKAKTKGAAKKVKAVVPLRPNWLTRRMIRFFR